MGLRHAALLVSAVALVSCSSADDAGKVVVTRVIDGDTVETDALGTVRLIGVDTPEAGDCQADAATAFTRSRLEGETVRYELGEDSEDRYGRTLAYLGHHNLALVEQGHAEALAIPPNDEYADTFERAEKAARRTLEGRWWRC
jgi:micrococcal nuclease